MSSKRIVTVQGVEGRIAACGLWAHLRRRLWWHLECCLSHQARQTPQKSVCHSPGIQDLQLQAEGYAYAQVEKLLENEHLEKDQLINPLAPCIALELVLIALVKQWAE